MLVSPTYEGEESVEMVWVWIIVVIIVIALIIWWLLARRKSAQSTGGQPSVGRHVASSERTGAPGGAGDAASTGGAAGQPVFDQEAHPQEVPAVDATDGAEAPMVPAPAPQATPAAEPSVDPHDAPTQAVPAMEAQQATETTGEAAVPTGGEAAAVPGGSVDAPSGADGPAQEREVLHTTGSTGDEQLVASGSPSNDDPRRADTDAVVAAENDDPQMRAADAPPESAADAAQHGDAELADTPVEHPAEGEVAAGGAAVVGGGAAAAAAAHHDGPESAAPADSASADSAGADPMTERFGEGAASPRPDGSAPEGHSIKGNADSMLFHTPDSPRYDATNPAVWFKDESTATAAGFAHWDRTKRGGAAAAPAGTPTPAATTTPAPAPEPATPTPTPAAAPEPAATPEPAAPGATRTPGSAPTPAAEPEQRVTASSPTDGEDAPSVGEEAVTGGEGAAEGGAGGPSGAPDPMQEQFGPGAASPREDGSAPTERHTIKGNADSMLFHTADSPHYERTEAEVWFTDEEAAKAAGFKHWDHRKR